MLFWLYFMGCNTPSPPQKVISEPVINYLTIVAKGNDDVVENIASALQFKQIIPTAIIYDQASYEYAKEFQHFFPKASLSIQKIEKNILQSLSKDVHNVLFVTSAKTKLFNEVPQLESGAYITHSSPKEWTRFFTQSKQEIIPLKEIARFPLKDVPEPSGLAIHPQTNNLWTVSDETGQIFDLGIRAESPELVPAHSPFQLQKYEENDLEGIAFIQNNLCIVVESQRRFICYDSEFTEISNQRVEGPYDPKEDNKGPEGLCDDGTIINEGYPTAISNTGRILSVGTDISGIEKTASHYWILSQSDATLTKLDHDFHTVQTYSFPDEGLEGIAIYKEYLYLISDPNSILYQLQLPKEN